MIGGTIRCYLCDQPKLGSVPYTRGGGKRQQETAFTYHIDLCAQHIRLSKYWRDHPYT